MMRRILITLTVGVTCHFLAGLSLPVLAQTTNPAAATSRAPVRKPDVIYVPTPQKVVEKIELLSRELSALRRRVDAEFYSDADPQQRLAAYDQHVKMKETSLFKDLPWQYLGPTNISGRVTDVAVPVPRGKNYTLYVAAASGGVWKSQDGGTTFKPIFDKYTRTGTPVAAVPAEAARDVPVRVDPGGAAPEQPLLRPGLAVRGLVHRHRRNGVGGGVLPRVLDVRGQGLFAVMEMVKDRTTREPLAPWIEQIHSAHRTKAGPEDAAPDREPHRVGEPGPGVARARITYDPAETDEEALRRSITEPYFQANADTIAARWYQSPSQKWRFTSARIRFAAASSS